MKFLIATLMLTMTFVSQAAIFPTEKSQLNYSMTYGPLENPSEILHGELKLEIYKVTRNGDQIVTEFKERSTAFPRIKFFETVETSDSLVLNGVNYIGPGSDPIQEKFDFMPLPLTVGSKVDNPIIYSKIKAPQEIQVLGQTMQAYRINVIGSYQGFYTLVGDYWIVDGIGIVKADYNTGDGWNVKLELNTIEKL